MKKSIQLVLSFLFSITACPAWGAEADYGLDFLKGKKEHWKANIAFVQRVLTTYPSIMELDLFPPEFNQFLKDNNLLGDYLYHNPLEPVEPKKRVPTLAALAVTSIRSPRGGFSDSEKQILKKYPFHILFMSPASKMVNTGKYQLVGGPNHLYFGTVMHSPEVKWIGLFEKESGGAYRPIGGSILSEYLQPDGAGQKNYAFKIAHFNPEQNTIEQGSQSFYAGKLLGTGSITYSDLRLSEGRWGNLGNGEWGLTGEGSITYPDGRRCTGTWGWDATGASVLTGNGSITGSHYVFTGTWGNIGNGVWGLTGDGSMIYPDGRSFTGRWGSSGNQWVLIPFPPASAEPPAKRARVEEEGSAD